MSDNPYSAPQSSRGRLTLGDEPLQFSQTPQERNAGPEGLGGWLIVIGIKLVATILIGCRMLMSMVPVITGDTWDAITTPGTDAYHPLFGPLIIFELVGNLVLVGGSLALLVMFFRKAPGFPRWMIALMVFGPALTAVDLYWANQIPAADVSLDDGDVTGVARSIASACIWVPYLLVSKRVRNTFKARRTPRRRIEPVLESSATPEAGA